MKTFTANMEFERPLDKSIWKGLKGRCISCGYLGKRSRYYTEVYEASDDDRSLFSFVSHRLPPPTPSGTDIFCFINKMPLTEEFKRLEKQYEGSRNNSEISMEITLKDINCPKWVPYQPFRSPKEHFEDFKEELNIKERKRTNGVMIGLTIALLIFTIAQVFALLRAC